MSVGIMILEDEFGVRHDGRYDIDNTEAERKIRPLTIGRKNTLFFGSEEGVEVATTYYTLIETCKINGNQRLITFLQKTVPNALFSFVT